MNADFLDAHHRHWDDAERLLGASRWANADHLYGVSAECGLKRLMMVFGMPVNAGGSPSIKPDKVHANDVWLRYETYRSGRPQGVKYTLPPGDPFQDWDVSQRYVHQNHFDQARTASHRAGAEAVRELVGRADKEGLL